MKQSFANKVGSGSLGFEFCLSGYWKTEFQYLRETIDEHIFKKNQYKLVLKKENGTNLGYVKL